jgi:hypothetical protein
VDKLWKRLERETAAALGGRRHPSQGRPAPDITAGEWQIEHKARASVPGWIREALEQVERLERPRAAVVTVHEGKGRRNWRFVLVLWDDFVEAVSGQREEER